MHKSGRFKLFILFRRPRITRGQFTFPIIYHINNSPVRYIAIIMYLYIHHTWSREPHAMEKGSEVKDYVKNIFSYPPTLPANVSTGNGVLYIYCFPFSDPLHYIILIFVAKIQQRGGGCNVITLSPFSRWLLLHRRYCT